MTHKNYLSAIAATKQPVQTLSARARNRLYSCCILRVLHWKKIKQNIFYKSNNTFYNSLKLYGGMLICFSVHWIQYACTIYYRLSIKQKIIRPYRPIELTLHNCFFNLSIPFSLEDKKSDNWNATSRVKAMKGRCHNGDPLRRLTSGQFIWLTTTVVSSTSRLTASPSESEGRTTYVATHWVRVAGQLISRVVGLMWFSAATSWHMDLVLGCN